MWLWHHTWHCVGSHDDHVAGVIVYLTPGVLVSYLFWVGNNCAFDVFLPLGMPSTPFGAKIALSLNFSLLRTTVRESVSSLYLTRRFSQKKQKSPITHRVFSSFSARVAKRVKQASKFEMTRVGTQYKSWVGFGIYRALCCQDVYLEESFWPLEFWQVIGEQMMIMETDWWRLWLHQIWISGSGKLSAEYLLAQEFKWKPRREPTFAASRLILCTTVLVV